MRKSFQSYRYTEAGDISDTDLLDRVDNERGRKEEGKRERERERKKKYKRNEARKSYNNLFRKLDRKFDGEKES